jgi:hypothetical protein
MRRQAFPAKRCIGNDIKKWQRLLRLDSAG